MRLLKILPLGVGILGAFASATVSGLATLATQNTTWPIHSSGLTSLVQWDHYSLIVNNERIFLWSGEFHYWRIPVPSVWRDLLEKIKAGGFNAVSVYGHWAFHAASPHALDFESGARNFTSILDIAKEVGLYVVWRPGPYVNAESTAGGFALWTTTGAYGGLRDNDPRYAAAWQPYMTAYNRLLAPQQITRGGNLIMAQIENEIGGQRYSNGTEDWDIINYMKNLEGNARENGLEIPLFTNAPNQNTKSWSKDYDSNGAQDVYGLDSYPECWSTNINECGSVSPFTVVDYHSHFNQVSPTQPSFLPEFQGGAYTPWGGPRGGVSNLGSEFANVFYRHNVAERVTAMSLYMLYGGANWGGLATNLVGTDYNYSAPISADRTLTPKYYETKLLGLFLGVAQDLRMTDRIAYGTNYTNLESTTAKPGNETLGPVGAAELRNPVTDAGFYVLRHNVSASEESSTFKVNVRTSIGNLQVPRFNDAMTLHGRESKILVTDFRFANRTLLYSTAEVVTYTVVDGKPLLALWLPAGESGEVTFKGPNPLTKNYTPTAHVNSTTDSHGNTVLSWSQGNSTAILHMHDGTTVLLMPREDAYRLWAPSTSANLNESGESGKRILVRGPYLVRSATFNEHGKTIEITGDGDSANQIEVFAPSHIQHIRWNNERLHTTSSEYGTLLARVSAPSLTPTELEDQIKFGKWRMAPDALPERLPSYDANSQAWVAADKPASQSPNPLVRPGTDVVLFADEYGFHTGVLIWRAEFDSSKGVGGIWVNVQGGTAFGYSLWLNGNYIGSFAGDLDTASHNATFSFTNATLTDSRKNVVTLVQDHSGHDQRGDALQPRGLLGFHFIDSDGKSLPENDNTAVKWKLAGNAGGESNIDPVRGPIAEGGLHAERVGWHLPGFDDSHWKYGAPTDGIAEPGITFYRTTMDLHIPHGHDAMLSFMLGSTNGTEARAQLYVNGYQYGKFVPHIGAQTLFPVPPGILNYHGENTLALSLWAQGEHGAKVTIEPQVAAVVRSSWDPVNKEEAKELQPAWTNIRNKYV